jgi:hypothetical protein
MIPGVLQLWAQSPLTFADAAWFSIVSRPRCSEMQRPHVQAGHLLHATSPFCSTASSLAACSSLSVEVRRARSNDWSGDLGLRWSRKRSQSCRDQLRLTPLMSIGRPAQLPSTDKTPRRPGRRFSPTEIHVLSEIWCHGPMAVPLAYARPSRLYSSRVVMTTLRQPHHRRGRPCLSPNASRSDAISPAPLRTRAP